MPRRGARNWRGGRGIKSTLEKGRLALDDAEHVVFCSGGHADRAGDAGSRINGGVEQSGFYQSGCALFLLDRQALSFPNEAKGKILGENKALGDEVDR